MSFNFRDGFVGGAIIAFLFGAYLIWLWQPDHQIRLHAAHLIRQVEKRDWPALRAGIADDFRDDWDDDRERLLERMREVMRFVRNLQIHSIAPQTSVVGRKASWIAKIEVQGESSEVMTVLKERINSLSAPFELQWRRNSAKPWDWKLIRVSNSELKIEGY